MLVALDSTAGTNVQTFVASFFGFLKQHWGVEVRVSQMPLYAANSALQSGSVDVVVSSGSIAQALSVPFFGDPGGSVWSLYLSGDDAGFEAGLKGFLVPALETGEYGNRYPQAFGSLPNWLVPHAATTRSKWRGW